MCLFHCSDSVPSGEAPSWQQSAHYTVGQVSGSLSQQNFEASGSLSALFSTSAQTAGLLFQPARKKITKKEDEQEINCKVKEEPRLKKKKKTSSAADQKLQNRESSLQNADDEEKGQQSSAKKRKRRDSGAGRENDVEYWVMKRQKLKASKHEEALKSKRTVFVGNLPISCTEKTLRSFFRDQGPIESVRFRSVVREDPSMSRKVAVIK
ncbi:RNA-binding protein 34-like [Kryptolebias marmoratus]|uniref:RNA-binding protein 34-like n=1 Tax=Kryptolebias marmoratus TaxID=37003 RepID=UPI0007F8B9B6|nr:RNA-binding protein 34-like [Kryptolebias marmoratus]